jgi:protein ImuA
MAADPDIFARLQQDIFLLQGFKPAASSITNWHGLEQIKSAFPNSIFPTGAIHEFLCTGSETVSASTGFITGILSSLFNRKGAIIWISPVKTIFPPALRSFGLDPEKIIFIHLKKEKEKLFVMEEALKCDTVTAVVGQINEFSLTESRRFQLAVEQSKVTGFLLRQNARNLMTSSITRWQVNPLLSEQDEGLPGLGFPKWDVELLKVRNGKPGRWQIEWKPGRFLITPKYNLEKEEVQIRKIV